MKTITFFYKGQRWHSAQVQGLGLAFDMVRESGSDAMIEHEDGSVSVWYADRGLVNANGDIVGYCRNISE